MAQDSHVGTFKNRWYLMKTRGSSIPQIQCVIEIEQFYLNLFIRGLLHGRVIVRYVFGQIDK